MVRTPARGVDKTINASGKRVHLPGHAGNMGRQYGAGAAALKCSIRDYAVQAVSDQIQLFRRFVPESGTPLN
jgi:hypothetical protein